MAELLIQWERDIARLKNSSGSIHSQQVREFIDTMNQVSESIATVRVNSKERIIGGGVVLPMHKQDDNNRKANE